MTPKLPSNHNKQLFIISAPSGAGKTTIVKQLLLEFNNLCFSISSTTRKKRHNETDGVDYYFVSGDDFLNHTNKNDFIEWELVYEGKYYGTLKSELDRIWRNNKTPLLEVDVKGAIRLKSEHPDFNITTIFIQIPSIKILKERLTNRGTEDNKTIEDRIKKAEFELQFITFFDYVVINNDLQDCLFEVKKIIQNKLNYVIS